MPPKRKGILLAGGHGTRLRPLTEHSSKHLLLVAGRPMIEYPLATLVAAGIREVLLISTPEHLPQFRALLGDGRQRGLRLSYAAQARPQGIAQAFAIASDCGFLRPSDSCALILGDNLFCGGAQLDAALARAAARTSGASAFSYRVKNPSDYAVVELGADGAPLHIEEKPAEPRSPYAIPGLYFYDAEATELAATLRPSARGELEITDLNRLYLARHALHIAPLPPCTTWLDMGTPSALDHASALIHATKPARQK